MQTGQVCGAIVAAGRGKRMGPINYEYPKTLLPVANRPIIEHQIEAMKTIGIHQVFVVIGHLRQRIRDHLGDGQALGVEIRYVFQDSPQGIGHAVLQLEQYVDKPFLLCLGDIFFLTKDFDLFLHMMQRTNADGLLAVKRDEPKNIGRNFCVVVDTKGKVVRVMEKPQEPVTDLKGCGIYLFKQSIFEAIRRTPKSEIRNEIELTDAIQTLIDDGHSIYPVETIEWDVNVTYLSDLLSANLKWLAHSNKKRLVGQNARINPRAKVTDSVIGCNAVITNPVVVDKSCLFDGVRYEGTGDLVCSLLYGDEQVRCSDHDLDVPEGTCLDR